MLKKIPLFLILFRLLAGFLIIILAFLQPLHFRAILLVLLATGLLSDILDGIIARSLGVSGEMLRRLDSSADQVFWLCSLGACYIYCPSFFSDNWLSLTIVLALEACTYILSYIRFRKEVATHAILSKIWTLTILAVMVQLFLSCQSSWIFTTCIMLGIVSRIENLAILLLLKSWESDIPSVVHALQRRRGKDIKRNKLFNG